MKKNEKGFSVIEIFVVVVIVGLIATVGWLVWYRQKIQTTKSEETKTNNQQTTNSKTNPVETPKVDPNAGYLAIKEWGLRFKTPSGLTDVKYVIHDDTVAFYAKPIGTNVQYRSDYEKFDNGNFQYAMGALYRSTKSTEDSGADGSTTQGKKVGNHYYYTAWAFSSTATGAGCVGLYGDGDSNCQTEGTAHQLVNQGDDALLNTIQLAQ